MIGYLQNPALEIVHPEFPGNYFENGQFQSEELTSLPSFSKLLRWRTTPNPQQYERDVENFKVPVIYDRSFLSSDEDMIVWLGHASFFMRINGKTILTDPCLTDLPMIPRQVGLPCSIYELIGIDYLLLSHGHRDHLDTQSLKIILRQNPNMELLLPLKTSSLVPNLSSHSWQEAGWWQRFKIEGLDITFLPAKHWNRRGLFDYNTTLWGSFMIQTEGLTVYFGGDSAYAEHFEEIADVLGSPDIALLPVGAYKPAYMMKEAHMNPTEAVQAAHALSAGTMIPMHYGTYDLSDEPQREPLQMIENMQQLGQVNFQVRTPAIGESLLLSDIQKEK